jgi:hypothetical protein
MLGAMNSTAVKQIIQDFFGKNTLTCSLAGISAGAPTKLAAAGQGKSELK